METISGELTSIRLGLERRLFAVNSDEMQHLFKSLELSQPLPKIHHGNIPRAHLGGIDHLQVNNNMLYSVVLWNMIVFVSLFVGVSLLSLEISTR